MTAIIGYSFDAAVHCVGCTAARYRARRIAPLRILAAPLGVMDEHDVPDNLVDREDNPVRPILETDKGLDDGECCSDCGVAILV